MKTKTFRKGLGLPNPQTLAKGRSEKIDVDSYEKRSVVTIRKEEAVRNDLVLIDAKTRASGRMETKTQSNTLKVDSVEPRSGWTATQFVPIIICSALSLCAWLRRKIRDRTGHHKKVDIHTRSTSGPLSTMSRGPNAVLATLPVVYNSVEEGIALP
jgi:hypothetical protein